jgi:hypothetical protein
MEMENDYEEIFGCESGTLPIRYLGISAYYQKLKKS